MYIYIYIYLFLYREREISMIFIMSLSKCKHLISSPYGTPLAVFGLGVGVVQRRLVREGIGHR